MNAPVITESVQAILASLRQVIDPELGENIVDIGLIYAVTVNDEGSAHIVMTTTTRGCPAADFLREAVKASAEGTQGISAVTVELTYDPPWTPARISDRAASRL